MKNASSFGFGTLALLLACPPSLAQTRDSTGNAQKPDVSTIVEITGKRKTDIDERRDSAVTKIIVSHDEIACNTVISISETCLSAYLASR